MKQEEKGASLFTLLHFSSDGQLLSDSFPKEVPAHVGTSEREKGREGRWEKSLTGEHRIQP